MEVNSWLGLFLFSVAIFFLTYGICDTLYKRNRYKKYGIRIGDKYRYTLGYEQNGEWYYPIVTVLDIDKRHDHVMVKYKFANGDVGWINIENFLTGMKKI